jgi:energy-coupling factor transporter ATP-binding protein EcfA2
MELRKINYVEHDGKPQEWKIVDCTLGQINLMVGKNATGKTRTLSVIGGLAGLLSQASELKFGDGNYDVEFENKVTITKYCLEYHQRKVVREELIINAEKRLIRNDTGQGQLWAAELERMIKFQTPVNQIAAFVKRDSIQHPFLEDLHEWGNGLIRYNFGTALGKDKYLLAPQSDESSDETEVDIKQTEEVVRLFLTGINRYKDQFKQRVIDSMSRTGYQLEDIGIRPIPGVRATINATSIPADVMGIYVKERDRKGVTRQHEMSQGMFRALSVLIQIEYALFASAPTCILIDDIGEGLDFGRSSALVKLLIEKIIDTNIQIIMATNDRFIMNSVPLEYWIVLERKGERCIHHNYRNSKELFDEFALRGLSNFDFFASGYYLKNGE